MYIVSAFVVALGTYVFLLFADLIRPGFVSYTFSTHWLLVLILLLFGMLVYRGSSIKISHRTEMVITTLVSVVCVVVTWNLGRPLGDTHLLFTLLSAAIPFAVRSILHTV